MLSGTLWQAMLVMALVNTQGYPNSRDEIVDLAAESPFSLVSSVDRVETLRDSEGEQQQLEVMKQVTNVVRPHCCASSGM